MNRPGWNETIKVTVRGLRSQVVVGVGTIYQAPPSSHETIALSDAWYVVDGELGPGDSYTVRGYVPDPSVAEMQAAPPPDPSLGLSTGIQLPAGAGFGGAFVAVPMRGVAGTGTPAAAGQLERSPYARMYRQAQQLAAGAPDNYAVVKRIANWLEGHYAYSEKVAEGRYPLMSFLYRDRAGYCQQFSGAAALMLRMVGIPARIASGFTPGTLNPDTHEYVVRDLDAHSWIEVWFQGIGWVPFDPTPALAPASSRVTLAAPSAALGDNAARIPKKRLDQLLGARPDSATGAGGHAGDSHSGWPWGVIAVVAAALALLLSLGSARVRRRPRTMHPHQPSGDPDVDQLITLLARAGLDVNPRTTLFALEGRLRRLAGDEVAGYIGRLRGRRFGPSAEPPPQRADRRRLRSALARAVDAGPLTRLQMALPHRPRVPLRRTKLGR
jgi:transglutaminase-like putative cysteine protease